MSSSDSPERQAYHRWLDQNRTLLEAHRFPDAFKTYPFLTNEDEVWAPLTKELRECRIAVVSSAGLYLKDSQAPFRTESITGDTSYRTFPVETPADALAIAHGHYDEAAARQDLNSVLPIDRLREITESGVIGGLTPTVYSFMGYQTDAWDVRDRLGPEIAERVLADGADAAFVFPV